MKMMDKYDKFLLIGFAAVAVYALFNFLVEGDVYAFYFSALVGLVVMGITVLLGIITMLDKLCKLLERGEEDGS